MPALRLIQKGEMCGVFEGLADVGGPVLALVDLLHRRPEPARQRVASDHACR